MRESSIYMAILEEGRIEGRREGALAEARKILRLVGEAAFGPPDDRTAKRIEQCSEVAWLEEAIKHLHGAAGWQDLFGSWPTGRRGKRRPSS